MNERVCIFLCVCVCVCARARVCVSVCVRLPMHAAISSLRQSKNPVIAKQPVTMEKMKNELNKNIITIIHNNHDIFPYQRINSLLNYHPNLPITDVLQLCLSVVMEIYRNSLDIFRLRRHSLTTLSLVDCSPSQSHDRGMTC